MEDETLVGEVLRGHTQAFTHLVERYKTPVYNLAYRMLGNAEDAEDAAQEAFLRAYSQLRSYDRSRKFSSWLLSITAHLCIDQLRRRRFLWLPLEAVEALDWLGVDVDLPEKSVIDGEDRDEVRRLLHVLPAKYRLVLVLRYWYDMSYDEIARTTRLSEAAVKTRLHRAREMLSDHIAQRQAGLVGGDQQRQSLAPEQETDTVGRHCLIAQS